jgi:hypothetical protein
MATTRWSAAPVSSDSAAGNGDRILDFSVTDDTIDLQPIDADPGAGGDQAFAFVRTAAFSGPAAQVRYVQDGGNTVVQAWLAGSASVNLEIVLTGLHNLTAADFVL